MEVPLYWTDPNTGLTVQLLLRNDIPNMAGQSSASEEAAGEETGNSSEEQGSAETISESEATEVVDDESMPELIVINPEGALGAMVERELGLEINSAKDSAADCVNGRSSSTENEITSADDGTSTGSEADETNGRRSPYSLRENRKPKVNFYDDDIPLIQKLGTYRRKSIQRSRKKTENPLQSSDLSPKTPPSSSSMTNFTCPCGSVFRLHAELRNHMETEHKMQLAEETPEKVATTERFHCSYCERSYARKDVLEMHVLSHTTDSTTCKICDKRLLTTRILKRHNYIYHSGRRVKLQCSKCGCWLYSQESLRKHLVVKHKLNQEEIKNFMARIGPAGPPKEEPEAASGTQKPSNRTRKVSSLSKNPKIKSPPRLRKLKKVIGARTNVTAKKMTNIFGNLSMLATVAAESSAAAITAASPLHQEQNRKRGRPRKDSAIGNIFSRSKTRFSPDIVNLCEGPSTVSRRRSRQGTSGQPAIMRQNLDDAALKLPRVSVVLRRNEIQEWLAAVKSSSSEQKANSEPDKPSETAAALPETSNSSSDNCVSEPGNSMADVPPEEQLIQTGSDLSSASENQIDASVLPEVSGEFSMERSDATVLPEVTPGGSTERSEATVLPERTTESPAERLEATALPEAAPGSSTVRSGATVLPEVSQEMPTGRSEAPAQGSASPSDSPSTSSSLVVPVANRIRKVKCPHCRRRFPRLSAMQVHKRNAHRKKVLKCPLCSFECNQQCQMEDHLLCHTKSLSKKPALKVATPTSAQTAESHQSPSVLTPPVFRISESDQTSSTSTSSSNLSQIDSRSGTDRSHSSGSSASIERDRATSSTPARDERFQSSVLRFMSHVAQALQYIPDLIGTQLTSQQQPSGIPTTGQQPFLQETQRAPESFRTVSDNESDHDEKPPVSDSDVVELSDSRSETD